MFGRRSKKQLAAIHARLRGGMNRIDRGERRQLKRTAGVALAGAGLAAAGVALAMRGPKDAQPVGGKMALVGGTTLLGGGTGFYERLRDALKDGPVKRVAGRALAGADVKAAMLREGGKRAARTLQFGPLSADRAAAKIIDWGAVATEDAIQRNLNARVNRITTNAGRLVGQAQFGATHSAFRGLDSVRRRTAKTIGKMPLHEKEQLIVSSVQREILKGMDGIIEGPVVNRQTGARGARRLRSKPDKALQAATRDVLNQMAARGELTKALYGDIPDDVLERATMRLGGARNTPEERDRIRRIASGQARFGELYTR